MIKVSFENEGGELDSRTVNTEEQARAAYRPEARMTARWTEGDVAETFALILNGELPVKLQGWKIEGCDIGEIEVVAPNGTKYRLTVEIVED